MVQEALVTAVQFDGEQGMCHRVHDSGCSLFGTAHSTAHTNRCTVFPAKVGKLANNHHDAIDGVFVFEALGGEVSGRVAGPHIGNRGRRIPTNPVGFSDTKSTLSCARFGGDTNRRSFFFEFPLACSFFVENQFGLSQSVQAVSGHF